MDTKSLLVFSIPFALNLVLLVSLFFTPWHVSLFAIVLKASVDLLLAIPSIITFKRWTLLWIFPLFEIYYVVYVAVFPLIVLFKSEITWKERTFQDGNGINEKPPA